MSTIIKSGRFQDASFVFLTSELTITCIAHFGTYSILLLHLTNNLDFSAAESGFTLLLFSIFLRFSRIPAAYVVSHFPVRRAIMCSLLMCAGGYLGLAYAGNASAVLTSLMLIGIGYGTNGMLVLTMVSYGTARDRTALMRYATVSVMTYIAFAIGPLATNFLRLDVSPAAPFLFASGMLLLAAAVSLLIPANLPSLHISSGFLKTFAQSLRRREVRAALLMVAFAWFLGVQLFAIFPLFIEAVIGEPELLGTFFVLNAGLMICLTLPFSRLAVRFGLRPATLIQFGIGAYAVSFALFGSFPTLLVAYFAIVLWTLGATLMDPACQTMLAQSGPQHLRLASFSLHAAASGIGEGLGSFLGVLLIDHYLSAGNGGEAFLVMAGIAFGLLVAAFFLGAGQRTARS